MAATLHDEGYEGYEGYEEYGEYAQSSGAVRTLAQEEEVAEILGQSWSTPTQAALVQVTHGLAGLSLPPEVRQALLAVLTSTAAHHDPYAQRDPGQSSTSEDATGQRTGNEPRGQRTGNEPRAQRTGNEPRGQRSTARVASVEAISDQAVLAAAHGTRVLAGFAEAP